MMNSQLKYGNIKVLILAGGNSSRMNFPKAWLPYNSERTILEQLVLSYRRIGCRQIVVVMNEKFIDYSPETIESLGEGVCFVRNEHPEKGKIYSLKLGIGQLDRSGLIFIHNVDNPSVGLETFEALMQSKINGYARPVINGKGGHPILVTNGVLENILLSDDSVILKELLQEHSCEDVPVTDLGIFCNINTPEDYRNMLGMEVPSLKRVYSP